MARPKKEIPPAYTHRVTVRLTDEMYAVLHKDAETARISDAECVRKMILGRKIKYAPTVVHDDTAILEELRRINKVGSNLNQIARYLNEGGNMTNPIAVDLRKILQALNECCNALNRKMEDEYGCPLIGPSGQLLDKALWATKMTRDRVLTTNVIKCRPKGNRTPDIVEAERCAKLWLDRELAIIKPKVIVALGGVALHYLGNPDMRITRDRGQWFRTEQGYDCIATYHPAYLLRQYGKQQIAAKWDVFHDLTAARERAEQMAPGYQFMSEEMTKLFQFFPKKRK